MRNTCLYLLSTILLVMPSSLFGQETEMNLPKEWIQKTVELRDYFLRQNKNSLYELRDLLNKWNRAGLTEKEQTEIALFIVSGSKAYGFSSRYVAKKSNKYFLKEGISVIVSEQDVNVLTKNFELFELQKLGILKNKYPFIIDSYSLFFRELQAFEIKGTENIAEIGSGSGMFGLISKYLFEDLSWSFNEVRQNLIKLIDNLISEHSDFIKTENLSTIKGKKNSTNLVEKVYDKIIIRQTLHHFKKMDDMLISIKKSMDKNTRLYLLETYRDDFENEKDLHCSDHMFKKDILEALTRNGLKLISETKIGHQIVLKIMKD